MSWFIPSEIAQMALSSVLALVFFYHYWHDRKIYLLIWGSAWTLWSLKYPYEILAFLGHNSIIIHASALLCWLLGGTLLPIGIFKFIDKKLPRIWTYGAISLCLWIFASLFIGLPDSVRLVPIFFFLGLIFIWAGVGLLKSKETEVTGKYITGWLFIILGIHLADYPFLVQASWLAAIGYIIAAILAFVLAHSTLLVYYQKIRDDLSKNEQRFRLLAENAQDIIFRYQLNPKPSMEYISPAAATITGYTIDEFYNDPDLFVRLIHPEHRSAFSHSLEPDIMLKKSILRWVKKDGKTIWVELYNTPILNKERKPLVVEGIARDVTARKLAEEKALRNEKSRRDLLTNVSHDLRTPITSIQGYLEALLENVISEPEEREQCLRLVHTRVLGINRLIQDLFDLTRLETQQTSFHFSRFSLEELMDITYEKYKYDVEQAGKKLLLEKPAAYTGPSKTHAVTFVETSLKDTLTIDYDRIDQVFNNLISNALKHTPINGRIVLSYMFAQDKEETIITIQNDGAGIAEKDLPYIFDRFYKASKSRESSKNSSGLGLAISKEIVNAHGGLIWAESILNRGSSFHFTLPVSGTK
ncbi:ATP-binding protein [Metallumcola ferriviriculae]|uniref:histidine kinase n=1 Tax=Metallumcola ferriviriculae TaxID=3039180 RepID=A0AAU0UKP2_9FIRM|nr:ATP-binding protein [Desulfitibacteraceae bacterium MK1]